MYDYLHGRSAWAKEAIGPKCGINLVGLVFATYTIDRRDAW